MHTCGLFTLVQMSAFCVGDQVVYFEITGITSLGKQNKLLSRRNSSSVFFIQNILLCIHCVESIVDFCCM